MARDLATVISADVGTLFCGDNLALMADLPDGSCDLIYVDPPFNSRRRRTSRMDRSGYDDRWPDGLAGYLDFLRQRIGHMYRLLSARGSLYFHADWRTVHYSKIMLDEVFGRRNFLNEIVWSYRTGGRCDRWFARKHDTLLLYAKNAGRHTFHVLRDGQYRTDGLKRDEGGRPYKSTRKGRLYFDAAGPAMTDVWEIPFLSTVSLERTGYPTQKPLALLRRIVAASSDPGDVVADFFCGSGTALVAAAESDRRWLGCDVEPRAVDITVRRLGRVGSDEVTEVSNRRK